MDKLVNNPKFQIVDSSGVPLSGGLIYTYEGGTSTPLATYSDRDLSSANSNPVVLDSRGECMIYTTEVLKIVVKTSAGVTVWTEDDIKPINITVLGDADNDTKVQVEESSDEDVIRFDTAGTQRAKIDSNGLMLETGADVNEFSTDGTLAGDSDDAVPTEKAVKTYVDNIGYTPTGSILMWSTGTAPTGFLECNGAAVSRTTYATLFAVIGVIYGNGDASTTFNLPDLRGQFIRGYDHGAGTDPDAATRTDRGDGTAGDNVGTKQAADVGDHVHALTGSAAVGTGGSNYRITSLTTGAPSGTIGDVKPTNVGMMFIIKT